MWRQLLMRCFARRSIGEQGERIAADYLKQLGYRIRGRNLRCRLGEVDILAQTPDGRTLVIVEVKSAHAVNTNLPPEVHVNHAKQRKLTALAAHFARRYALTDQPIRFDVIAVEAPASPKPVVRHHPGAFNATV